MLKEMGLDLPAATEIRVWDTSADTRYMVLPLQPEETKAARRETRRDRDPGQHDRRRAAKGALTMDGMHDLGGKQGFGAIAYPTPPHAETWEPPLRAIWMLGVRAGLYNMDEYRHAIERMAPVHYMSAPYYERTLTAVRRCWSKRAW